MINIIIPKFDYEVDNKSLTRIPYGVPGVYVLYDEDGSAVYVGQSQNLRRRVHDHLKGNSNISRYEQSVCMCKAFIEKSFAYRFMYEESLIAQLNPPLNIHYNKANFKGINNPKRRCSK